MNNIVHLTATLKNYISAAEPADLGPEVCPNNVAHCETERDEVAMKEAVSIGQCSGMQKALQISYLCQMLLVFLFQSSHVAILEKRSAP